MRAAPPRCCVVAAFVVLSAASCALAPQQQAPHAPLADRQVVNPPGARPKREMDRGRGFPLGRHVLWAGGSASERVHETGNRVGKASRLFPTNSSSTVRLSLRSENTAGDTRRRANGCRFRSRTSGSFNTGRCSRLANTPTQRSCSGHCGNAGVAPSRRLDLSHYRPTCLSGLARFLLCKEHWDVRVPPG